MRFWEGFWAHIDLFLAATGIAAYVLLGLVYPADRDFLEKALNTWLAVVIGIRGGVLTKDVLVARQQAKAATATTGEEAQ